MVSEGLSEVGVINEERGSKEYPEQRENTGTLKAWEAQWRWTLQKRTVMWSDIELLGRGEFRVVGYFSFFLFSFPEKKSDSVSFVEGKEEMGDRWPPMETMELFSWEENEGWDHLGYKVMGGSAVIVPCSEKFCTRPPQVEISCMNMVFTPSAEHLEEMTNKYICDSYMPSTDFWARRPDPSSICLKA